MEVLLILFALAGLASIPFRWMRRRHLDRLARSHGWLSWRDARRGLAIRRSSSYRRKEQAIRERGPIR